MPLRATPSHPLTPTPSQSFLLSWGPLIACIQQPSTNIVLEDGANHPVVGRFTTTAETKTRQNSEEHWTSAAYTSMHLYVPTGSCIKALTLLWYQCSTHHYGDWFAKSVFKQIVLFKNDQIFNDSIVVLQKMFKHISLHTGTCPQILMQSSHYFVLTYSSPYHFKNRVVVGFRGYFFL